jgi:hypothetical protein
MNTLQILGVLFCISACIAAVYRIGRFACWLGRLNDRVLWLEYYQKEYFEKYWELRKETKEANALAQKALACIEKLEGKDGNK